jgi:deazaflavin-dependent oxidoreductase (nitroreductase family)
MNVRDTVGNVVVGLHRTIYRVSGGKLLSGFGGMPVLEVVTTGAKSGKKRAVMLTSPLKKDGQYVVVASKGGDARHPNWYHNMVAHPDVAVTIKGKSGTLHARVLNQAERDEFWPQVVKAYKGYGGYQEKTDRTIPLIVLEGQL